MNRDSKINPGGYLLSHTVAHAVPSAFAGLTSLFGMGRGVAPQLLSPEKSAPIKSGT